MESNRQSGFGTYLRDKLKGHRRLVYRLSHMRRYVHRLWQHLLVKPRPYPDDYSYQTRLMHLVPERGVVLDLASGHNPFPKATILSDRYLEITQHRRQEITLDHRPFVILDVHALPFITKSIDYVYCSHVIEHVAQPELACAEMMRVGKAGYIETPTFMKDALFGWAKDMGHRWHIVRIGNHLVFFEYDERRQQGLRSEQWRQAILSDYYDPLQDMYYPNQDVFNTHLEWGDTFGVTVYRQASSASEVVEEDGV